MLLFCWSVGIVPPYHTIYIRLAIIKYLCTLNTKSPRQIMIKSFWVTSIQPFENCRLWICVYGMHTIYHWLIHCKLFIYLHTYIIRGVLLHTVGPPMIHTPYKIVPVTWIFRTWIVNDWIGELIEILWQS